MSTSAPATLTAPAPAGVPSPIEQILTAVRPLLREALCLWSEIEALQARMITDRDALLWKAWRFGKVLVAMKEEIGHGRWGQFLAGHWPVLDPRDARRCMALFRENPTISPDSGVLTPESVRKFMWDYIPEKERPEIEGDDRVPPAGHHLTVVNQVSKWTRQMKVGAVSRPEPEIMRRDFQPALVELFDLLGRDWCRELLDGSAPAGLPAPPPAVAAAAPA